MTTSFYIPTSNVSEIFNLPTSIPAFASIGVPDDSHSCDLSAVLLRYLHSALLGSDPMDLLGLLNSSFISALIMTFNHRHKKSN